MAATIVLRGSDVLSVDMGCLDRDFGRLFCGCESRLLSKQLSPGVLAPEAATPVFSGWLDVRFQIVSSLGRFHSIVMSTVVLV